MGRRACALLAACAAAVAAGCSRQGTLWLKNGLEVPVRVQVAGQPPVELQPDEHRAIQVPSGSRELETATLDGMGHEGLSVDVPRGGTAVYSVAGAAPIFVRTDFFAGSGENAPQPRLETLCGQRTFTGQLDRYFEPPPEGLKSSGTGKVISSTTLVASKGGWQTCVNMLQMRGQDRAAAALLPPIRAMQPGKAELWAEAELRALSGDEPGALALLRGATGLAADREHHAMYLQLGRVLGKRADLIREYQVRAKRDPGNPEWRYQVARMLPAPEAVPELQALVRDRPEDAFIRLSLAWKLAESSRFPEALAALGPLGDGEKLGPAEQFWLANDKAWVLAALGRYQEAIQVLQADRTENQRKLAIFVKQGLLAARLGRADLEPDLEASQIGTDPWLSVSYDGQVHPERLDEERFSSLPFGQRVAQVMMKAKDDPKAALAIVRRFTNFDAQFLPEPVAYVLIGEAWRTGDQTAAAMLRRPLLGSARDLRALRDYVLEGRRSQDSDGLWEDCAAIHLARSRVLRARGDVLGAAAEERLVLHDSYGGPATRALREWPPVAPGSAPPPPEATQLASAKQAAPAKSRDTRVGKPIPKPAVTEHVLQRLEGVTLEREP